MNRSLLADELVTYSAATLQPYNADFVFFESKSWCLILILPVHQVTDTKGHNVHIYEHQRNLTEWQHLMPWDALDDTYIANSNFCIIVIRQLLCNKQNNLKIKAVRSHRITDERPS